MKPIYRLALTIAAFAVLTGFYLGLDDSEFFRLFAEPRLLVASIRNMQILGPLLIIGLMTLAIVLNPLPSAPIALAAGAVYGHTLGTVYIVAGAELGAITAFAIARWAGYDFTRRYFAEAGSLQRIGSQNTLTVLVFVSRLIPFMSFDLVSYAAGLSPLKLWRFALATLLGLIPVSFALAHFGTEIESGNFPFIVGIVLFIGLLTIAPILFGMFRSRKPVAEPADSDLRH